MMAEATSFLVPTSTVPVAPEIGSGLRNDDQVANTDPDEALTTGTHVALACLVRLDRMHKMVFELTQESRRIA